jgi:PST family polysaccharide transporter
LLAVFVGPSGMALVGNLRNFMTSVVFLLWVLNGIVKYVAEIKEETSRVFKLLANPLFYMFSFVAIL